MSKVQYPIPMNSTPAPTLKDEYEIPSSVFSWN